MDTINLIIATGNLDQILANAIAADEAGDSVAASILRNAARQIVLSR